MDQDILKQDKILLDASDASATTAEPAVAPKPKKLFHPVKTAEQRKAEKTARRQRDARIIVRNLSFKCTEPKIREHFGQFGPIVELNVLKRPDGKLVGCAFVQYGQINQAAKAIAQSNGKDLHGRPVYVDFALNKTAHVRGEQQRRQREAIAAKESTVEVKDEEPDDDASIKSEDESDDANEEDNDDEDDEENDDEDEDDDEVKRESDSDDDENAAEETEQDERRRKQTGKDVLAEGCTVFVRNVPFDATEHEFAECARRFGQIHYARITMDAKSGHSKGTGFIKYRARESADMCLQAGTDFRLLDQVLDPMPFCTKDDIERRAQQAKAKQPADSRNLYLTKEGLITAGSPAAEGVSPSDMAKRLRLEQIKTQMLKNLNKFVSRERLVIHNVPLTYDSAKLCTAVRQHAKLKPRNWRVEREHLPSPGLPNGKSKGFGFLDFDRHEDALLCLRRLNNNPAVFGANNRPIVAFSLEDKSVHNLKERRLKRSIEKNPTVLAKKQRRLERRKAERQQKLALRSGAAVAPATDEPDARPDGDEEKPRGKSLRRKAHKAKIRLLNRQKKAAKLTAVAPEAASGASTFTGVLAEPGTGAMRPRWKLTQQSVAHVQDVTNAKRDARKEREKRALLDEKKQVDRTKRKKTGGNEVDNFSFMVDKYKQLIDASNDADRERKAPAVRSKWYTE